MHELSLCASIGSIAERHAAGRPVATINVRIGQLRQVVPDTLVYCWDLVSDGTSLAGARLAVEEVPALLGCRGCGAQTQLGGEPSFACRSCGSVDVSVVAGEEFLITSLELAESPEEAI